MYRKSPSFGERAVNSLLQKEFITYPDKMQVPAVLFDRLRSTYAVMFQRHNYADIEYDRSRIDFLKARRTWMQEARI